MPGDPTRLADPILAVAIDEAKPPSHYISNPHACRMTIAGFGWNPINYFLGTKYVDCDCHRLGTCSKGEPKPPSTFEFEQDPAYNYTGPPLASYPWLLEDHRYVAFRKGPGRVPPPVSFKRSIVGRGKDRAPILPELAYDHAVLRAFRGRPKTTQANIVGTFESARPGMIDESVHLKEGNHGVNPRAVLATLLSNPGKPAGATIMSMPTTDLNLLLHCTENAIDAVQKEYFPQSLKHRSPKDLSHSLPYYNTFASFTSHWRTYTPPGLSHKLDSRKVFTFSTIENDSIRVHTDDFGDICNDVWGPALEQIDDDNSYVASVEETMTAIYEMIESSTTGDRGNYNVYLESIVPTQSEPWTPLTKFEWTDRRLEHVFGSAKPSVQITLAYLALTLWTGHPQWNHTLERG